MVSSAQTERPEGICQRFLAFIAKHHFETVQGRQKVTGIVCINSVFTAQETRASRL